MSFMKRFLKNKVLVLSSCVIIVSLVYIGIQKVIDSYNFNANNNIAFADDLETFSGGDVKGSNSKSSEDGDQNDVNENSENTEDSAESVSEISSEETNLVLEEAKGQDGTGENEESKNDVQKEAQSKIYVYITGEVNNPGVVILNEGSRIVDAINAAGGTTAKADISKVNLVYVLDDGMKVNIPNNNDLKNNSDFEYITMNSGDGRNDEHHTGNSSFGSSSGTNGENNTGSDASFSSKKYDVVNINTATQTELETLPGIGPSLALKIINYRKENGKFSSIEQIKDVSGIGESKFENLKSYITL